MMRRQWRRLLANLYFLRKPFLEFAPALVTMIVIIFLGGISFHYLYHNEEVPYLSFPRALYITYCLLFMEHIVPYPDHWLLEIFYFVLPVVGLVVITGGLS